MAKFCTKCGEPLTENHVCKVKDDKKEIKEESSVIDDVVDIYKNAVTKPITIIKEYIEKIDMKVIAIIAILGMIISGLSYYCVTANSLKGAISDATSKITGAALMQGMDEEKEDSLFGSSNKETIDEDTINEMVNAKDNIQVPFTSMFILGAVGLISLLAAFTLSAKIFIGLCFKAKASMMEFLKLHTLALPLHSILILISTLLSYVSYKISGPILIFSLVIYIIIVVEGYIEVIKANKNRLMYSVALTTIVALVVSVVIVGITASAMLANFYAQQTALYQ